MGLAMISKIEADLEEFLKSEVSAPREELAWNYVVHLLAEKNELRKRILAIREIAMERVDLVYGNAGSYVSICMECGEWGVYGREESIEHKERCNTGRLIDALNIEVGIK